MNHHCLGMVAAVLFAAGQNANAQISIDTSDFSASLAPGKNVTKYIDSLTITIDIGATGSSSWDFSALHTVGPVQFSNAVPDTTPWFSGFPSATHAMHALRDTVISGLPATVSLWQYLMLNSSYFNPGFGASISGLPFPVTVTTSNAGADTTYVLPLTYGTQWHSTYTSTRIMSINGSVAQTTVTNHSTSNYVDAYGSMTLPGGGMIDVLRVRKVDVQTVAGIPRTVLTFLFLSKNGAVVNIAPTSPADTTGTINIAGSPIAWNGPVAQNTSGVAMEAAMPCTFGLQQNYPNPFNPSTSIKFQIPIAKSQNVVTLKVFDVLGKEVATLVHEVVPAGEHTVRFDAGSLASGVYFYRLEAGSFMQTRKMVILK